MKTILLKKKSKLKRKLNPLLLILQQLKILNNNNKVKTKINPNNNNKIINKHNKIIKDNKKCKKNLNTKSNKKRKPEPLQFILPVLIYIIFLKKNLMTSLVLKLKWITQIEVFMKNNSEEMNLKGIFTIWDII